MLRKLPVTIPSAFSRGQFRSDWPRQARFLPLVILGTLLAACSSGASPTTPPVAPTPEVIYPVLAPSGVPPVTGYGALAVVPAGTEQRIPVSADLGNGWLATIYVPSQPSASVIVRLQVAVFDSDQLRISSTLPDDAIGFSLEFYDSITKDRKSVV